MFSRQIVLGFAACGGQLLLGIVEILGGRLRILVRASRCRRRRPISVGGGPHLLGGPRQAARRFVGLQTLKLTGQAINLLLQFALLAAEASVRGGICLVGV